MADRDSTYAWLQGATFRHTNLSQRKLIEGLISEGRAEWVKPWNRARAIPNPPPKRRRASPPSVVAIANKLRSCALVLKLGGNPAGPREVIESIVADIDAWESGQSESNDR